MPQNFVFFFYNFGQTWDALTLQDSWNDLQFGMDGVKNCILIVLYLEWSSSEGVPLVMLIEHQVLGSFVA